MAIEWSREAIFAKLNASFLHAVLINMKGDKNALVRLGTQGTGVQPNYQITFNNGSSIPFNGANHEEDSRVDLFESAHLSQPFILSDIYHCYNCFPKSYNQAKHLVVEYFQANKSEIPPTASAHRDKLIKLVQKGIKVENAFQQVDFS